MTDAEELLELSKIRPMISELQHRLAIEHRRAENYLETIRSLRMEIVHLRNQQLARETDGLDPQDTGTRTIGGRA